MGRGIDVGSGDDPLSQYRKLFPLMESCDDFDKDHGDAQYLSRPYSFLYSSHCLEHLRDPWEALRNWCGCVNRGGHLIVMVPDEDMYEQGVWPSRFNDDHKHTFTMYKPKGVSWSPVSINVLDLVSYVSDLTECVSVQKLDATYLPDVRGDQTLGIGECAIEFILQRH